MDICDSEQKKVNIKCNYHKEFTPSYILLNANGEDNVLICNECIEDEEKYHNLVVKQYQSIETLLIADDRRILTKWPLLKQQGLLHQIKQLLSKDSNHLNHQKERVIAYFDSLQTAVVKHIDEIKKQMLQKCSILPDLEEKLYSEYNQIADKEKLKEILMKSNSSFEEVDTKLREIIKQKEEQKEQNEESLTKIFNSYLTNLKQFDENAPNQQMNYILKLIKDINFFPEAHINKDQSLNNQDSVVNLLVKVIENKTNFFTQEFTEKIKEKLNEWSFILNEYEYQVKNVYTEGYEEPLSFEGLSEKQFKNLEALVENMKNKQTNIELTPEVRFITDLINSPINYLTKEFSEEIQLTMRQLTPFFDGLEVKEANQLNKTPISFRKITEEQVELIHNLVIKMQVLKYEINPNSIDKQQLPYSNFILENIGKQNLFSDHLNLLFQQYPICELIKTNQKLQFIKGYYGSSQTNTIQIEEIDDSQMNFTKINNTTWVNIMSNWYLKKQKTYQIIFEINYHSQQQFHFYIGISSNEKNNIANNDKLSFYTNNYGISTGYGMDKIKKGSRDNLKHQKQLQLNVNLSKGILEIGDYPNLNNIVEVDDDKKAKLQQDIFYQIVFSMYTQNDQLLIKSIKEINE